MTTGETVMTTPRFDCFNENVQLERQRRAYHEAGHAIAALSLGFGIAEITIEGDNPHTYHVMCFEDACNRFGEVDARERLATVQYAGGVAQRKWQEETVDFGCEPDAMNAYANLKAVSSLSGTNFDDLRQALRDRTEGLVGAEWSRILLVGHTLLRAGSLSGTQIAALLDLERMMEQGPATDIFRAEQALAITNTIGSHVDAVNASTFAPILVALQTYSIEQFVLALNRVFERPNRKYPLQSLPAIVQFVLDNAEHLPAREMSFLCGLEGIGAHINGLDGLDDLNKTLVIMGVLQHVMPTPEDDPGLNALKALRDKKLAHPEVVEVERIPRASWEQAEWLLERAKGMLGVLGAWTCTAYVANDGDYLMSYDSEIAAIALRRMLREIGVDVSHSSGAEISPTLQHD
jgi:hypothetical protein